MGDLFFLGEIEKVDFDEQVIYVRLAKMTGLAAFSFEMCIFDPEEVGHGTPVQTLGQEFLTLAVL